MESKNSKELFLLRFGEGIRIIREVKGWTQEYAAEKGRLSSRQHLTDLEAGKKAFDVFTLRKLTQMYGNIVLILFRLLAEEPEF